ncbi:MAG: CRISPR-associated helicase Cas3' [Porticoccaceae bacterium]
MTFYAHSAANRDESEWQKLVDHLIAVGKLAAEKASHFNGAELAEVAGKLHDLGKYCDEFQARLRGSPRKVDHATWGARVAKEKYPQLWPLLAYAIAGHHAGLADGMSSDRQQAITPLAERLRQSPVTSLDGVWQREITLPSAPDLPPFKQRQGYGGFQLAMLGRMIYSCLVDADFLDTETFYRKVDNLPPRDSQFPSLATLRDQLNQFLSQPRFQSSQGVNATRGHILAHVRREAAQQPGLFSLNVPTGGGKTLSSLAFALDHAITHGLRRVILVIPFTSIVEQNAAVFREALGPLGEQAVLEHHSAFSEEKADYSDPDSRDKLRQAAENWEAPIVVTTAVQFFESLFANRSSRCRKLHNIASSVVILDEAQTLPVNLLRPCVAAIDELACNYRSSLVLCTATQPALQQKDGFEGGLENVRELAPSPAQLHQQLERVTVAHVGAMTDDDLTAAILAEHQVLCIVNNRRHARSLFEAVRHQPGTYHLTTLMCASHRSDKLREVRGRLNNGEPCRLISTSLIEAGVDVDFPAVYRADAGLDSIAQAAGRCNREGKRPKESSHVRVFTVASDWSTPPELAQYTQSCQGIFRRHANNPLSLAAIRDYFREVYWLKGKQLDAHQLLQQIETGGKEGIPYEQLARHFRMIESNMTPIIVPYNAEVAGLARQLSYAEYVGGLARKLQPYLVQVPEQGLQALRAVGAVQPVNETRFGNQFMQLMAENLYDPDCGLSWDNPGFISAEASVL